MKSTRSTMLVLLPILTLCFQGFAQTTQPSTQPADKSAAAEQILSQMLKPSGNAPRPLQPLAELPRQDQTTGVNAVIPNAPTLSVIREGTFIVDRTGRLVRSGDGQQMEFSFDSDGKSLQDPPVVILPNLKLMAMESAVSSASRDVRFRITGMVTEYKGRNHVLLEKVVVVPE